MSYIINNENERFYKKIFNEIQCVQADALIYISELATRDTIYLMF